MKISIVGIGRVGSTLAYTIALKGLCSELILVNRRPKIAQGDAYDLRHAMSFLDRPFEVRHGDLSATRGSDLIALCASVPTPAGLKSRLELLEGNVKLFRELIPPLAALSPHAVLLIVSNPVDVLTYFALKFSGFPPARVIGTGTLVDSARFRAMLSEEVSIHPEDLRAYILGEHGDHQFPCLSQAQAGGEHIVDNERRRKMFKEAVAAGYQVFSYKGYTNFAVSLAAALIIEAVAFDSKRTMPASVLIDGFHGISGVCLSLPVVIGRPGVTRILHPEFNQEEIAAFQRAAASVQAAIKQAEAILAS
ncbi:MAG: lactate dehydrogenase [Methylohalobius sp.]|nr:lactate dehydrogenase [Methylohalobius sp.]